VCYDVEVIWRSIGACVGGVAMCINGVRRSVLSFEEKKFEGRGGNLYIYKYLRPIHVLVHD